MTNCFSLFSSTREETATLHGQMAELQLKVKAMVVHTRLTSQAETKILLSKVDAVYSQLAQLEKIIGVAYKEIEGLKLGKQDLLSILGEMVPVSELNAVKAESNKLQEAINKLKLAMSTAQDEIEQQAGTIQVCPSSSFKTLSPCFCTRKTDHCMQSMVTRAELLSAQSEAKAWKDEAAAKAKDVALMESQVSMGQMQLQAALLDVAQLQTTVSAMVPRSELEAAKQLFDMMNAEVRTEEQVQRDLVCSLNDRLKALEDERSQLHMKLQVLTCCEGAGRVISTLQRLTSFCAGHVPTD